MPETYFEFVIGYLSLLGVFFGLLIFLWLRIRKLEKR